MLLNFTAVTAYGQLSDASTANEQAQPKCSFDFARGGSTISAGGGFLIRFYGM